MSVTVFIDGAVGTTGIDIRERLSGRTDITVVTLDDSRRKDADARAEALNDADIAILCLPDEAAREAAALVRSGTTRLIDASSAHRVAEGWTYGFPELAEGQAERIAAARFVSNPGCYPTAFLALVAPLVRAGLIPADWPLTYNAVSGYSGGGKAMIAEFEGGGVDTALRAYALTLAHKHLPEMRAHAGLTYPPVFAPAVARLNRGMLGEVPLALAQLPGRPSLAAIEQTLAAAYADSALISIASGDVAAVTIEENSGTDRMTLRVCGNADSGQVRLIATLDNLGKGAGGAAVQNLNIMAGLDPLAGLIV
ncbi:N-acetyl-gamma-glutamyl-phosphate reductase [Sphingomonas sp. CD22]|uniref:N-acetyl-gamma-glutamyl-phosphate reductase n=1 Tax=Sphingomonas sp. CD22 TaxID=3100214 RepID=UPI002ADF7921|nr:N-acetyl-gamma-glutamyl-phosphate reductase [Sphingomonas sp. CD22]MEA1084817.1 N-acetyl-gamma-glutamyl-phosphate reductase [Sphingomonas sp. CD22]